MRRLNLHEAAAMAGAGQNYMPIPHPVTAHQVTSIAHWKTSHGNPMFAKPGDWVVGSGSDIRSIASHIFHRTYSRLPDGRYQKMTPVRAVTLSEPTIVSTLEGDANGSAGDWLVTNGDDAWVISKTDFKLKYQQR